MKAIEKSLCRLIISIAALVCCLDTASAQNNTLVANPPQLAFNTAPGVIPAQTLTITSTNGPLNVTINTFSDTNWLQVTPTSGTTPLSLTVAIGPSAPTSADTGFINISAPGAFLSVAVTLTPGGGGGGGPSAITATPNSLSFSFDSSNSLPATKSILVTSNNQNVNFFTATPVINGGGSWLAVSPTIGSLPNTLQVTVTPSALPPGAGPFSAAVAINPQGTAGISVPVQVTVGGTPAIQVTPSQLSFAFQLGTNGPPAQALSIQSSTGANVSFSATTRTSSCGNNWLVLSQQFGVTPSTINAQINTSGLSAGLCSGEIDITGTGTSNGSVAVAVSLLVTNNPLLQVPTTGPSFTYQIGGGTPPAQNVLITSSGAAVNFSAVASPISGGPSFLLVNPATGITPMSVALSLNQSVLAGLGPGMYSENVSVSSGGAGNSPQTFPVSLVVSSGSVLTASVSSLHFSYEIGQAVPQQQSFTVSSSGAPVNFQVAANTSNCSGFLSAAVNGTAGGLTYGSQNVVVVSVNTTGIAPQTCSGNLTLTVPGTTTPALVIPVTLNVSTTALLNVSVPAINVTALVGAAASTQTVSVTSTELNTPLPFTATAATNPAGLTWLSVAPNSGTTPNNLLVTINPVNLAVGTYTGSITVASTAPNVPAQTIAVTLTIVFSNVTASPLNVNFVQSLGGAPPASQTVTINGVPAGTTIGTVATMFNGAGWLSAAVAANNTVTVTANGSQLTQGTYSGVVTVIVPGAGNSPLYIPVVLTVGAAINLSVSPASVTFNYQAGSSSFPQAQNVQVSSTGGSVSFNAVFNPGSAGSSGLVTVSPTSSTTPAQITLTANPSVLTTLVAGTYTATVVISSASVPGGNQTINVTVNVTGAAPPLLTSIVSAASLQPGPISPGEIVTIFGNGLGPATGISFQLVNGKVPTSLGNVIVTFNNVAAPLLYVSSTQINAIVPYEIAGQVTANVVAQFAAGTSAVFQVRVVDAMPAIFSASQSGNGQGAILNQNFTVNSSINPATKGSVIQIFGTGEGQLVPGVSTGSVTPSVPPFPKPAAQNITVTIGQIPSPSIQYAGEAPGLVSGVIQVNAVVPAGVGSGPQQVVLSIGGNTNFLQSITVAIQ